MTNKTGISQKTKVFQKCDRPIKDSKRGMGCGMGDSRIQIADSQAFAARCPVGGSEKIQAGARVLLIPKDIPASVMETIPILGLKD